MLCYDNGMYADRSRAVEVNIKEGKVVWESSGNPFIGRQSFSHYISSAQRLPNGNTLICDGGNGKFREVTKDNKVVWEYIRPTGNHAYPCFQIRPRLLSAVERTRRPQTRIHRYS